MDDMNGSRIDGSDESDVLLSEERGFEDSGEALRLGEGFELVLEVRDREVRKDLEDRPAGATRQAYALDALKIGVLALRQAQTRVDVDQIRTEGSRLVEQVRAALDRHQQDVDRNISEGLKEYFDPQSGRFNERVNRLIDKDGELEQLLRRQVGREGSTLTETLGVHLAPESPLMKALDAESPSGFLAGLRGAVNESLGAQEQRVLREFSLDNKEGALSRLVEELTERHGEVRQALVNSIGEVTAEFSLDREDSALSRLVGRVDRAQKLISSEFSLDTEGSALARMRGELIGVIEQLRQKNDDFQRDVLEQLTTIAANRRHEQGSTLHGRVFEEALRDEIGRERQPCGDVVEHTGSTTGRIKNCKKGDVVVRLGPDHVASGGQIVFEAKESQGYSLKAALDEIELARQNRDAGIGVFVFSSRTAPADLSPVKRYGQNVVVTWHPEEPESRAHLLAGLAIAEALVVRAAESGASEADVEAIDTAILAIEKQCRGFGEITKWAETAKSSAEKILSRAGSMDGALKKEIDALRARVSEVKTHLGAGD
jgi:hypothetical protein